ncbi:MAG: carbohydrate-binding protein, partial [Acidobacteriota bacterium]
MQRCLVFLVLSATLALAAPGAAAVQVTTAVELVQAVAAAPPGQVIELAAGTYVLDQSLVMPAGVTLVGAGVDATIVTGDAGWLPGVDALPSQETPGAYLLNLLSGAVGIEISQMTFTAPNLHGAIYAFDADDLEIFDVRFEGFRWAAIRAFLMSQFNVHDCVFVDAGGQVPGRTAGAIYADFTRDSTFWNNHIYRTPAHPYNFFGIKGEQIRFSRIHHNTIEVSFSLEFPFRNDEAVEIDHNYFLGVVSLPKFAGGPVYTDSFSYDVHHNVFQTAYAIELARNQMTVRNNLFLFDVYDDGGNLMSNFGSEPVPGPLVFADNLVQNPGRGVLWTRGPHDQLTIRNNHVRADTLTRVSGFFGINGLSDMATVSIRDNIIENTADNPRPLVRNVESTLAQIENNMLINVSDVGSYANPTTSAVAGPTAPLAFSAGVDGHFQVDGWNVSGLLPRHEAEDFTAADGTALYPTQDLGGGFKVGSISRDDTLDYTVVAPRTTTYRVAFRVSTPKDARAFEVLRDGGVLDTVTFDDTGGFEDWTTVFGEIDLIAGPQTLQLRALESRWDLNWFAIDRDEILAPVTIPAQIEAEDYAVRRGNQPEPTADVGGGENIGFVDDEDLLG